MMTEVTRIMRVLALSAAAVLPFMPSSAGWWSKDGEAPFGKISGTLPFEGIRFVEKASRPLTVFVTAYGIGQREIVELKERFDYEPVLFPVAGQKYCDPWERARRAKAEVKCYMPSMDERAYRKEAEALLGRLPQCDVLLFGRTDPAIFRDGDRKAMFERVKGGAALVVIAPWDKPVPVEGVELKQIDPERIFPVSLVPALAGTVLYEGRLGKGRVLEIVYPLPKLHFKLFSLDWYLETLTPYDGDHPLYYDFYHAFLGKCLWYAASRRPDAAISAERTAYNAEGEKVDESSASAKIVLVRKLNGRGEVADYTVSAPAAAGPTIKRVTFAKDAFLPGERISGELEMAPGVKGEVSASLVDDNGREIWRGKFPAAGGVQKLDIAFVHCKSRYARLSLRHVDGGTRDEAWARFYFNTVDGDRDDFCFSMWSDHPFNSRVSKIGLRQMRRHGVDNLMECGLVYGTVSADRRRETPRWIKEAGLNYSVWISNNCSGPKVSDMPEDGSCGIFDRYPRLKELGEFPGKPKGTFWCRNKTYVQDTAEGAKDLGVYFYNIGDENALSYMGRVSGENCFCGACQKRFRAYLKRVYGSLEAMNAGYRTKYKSWDDVKAMPFLESAKRRRMPLWADFRAFMEEQFLELNLYVKAEIEEIDPGAVIGSEGFVYPASSFVGYNFYKFHPHFRFAAPYFNDREVHSLKYLPPGSVRAAWYGTYEGRTVEPVLRRTPWRYLFAGLDGAFWWYAGFDRKSGSFSNCCIFRPDMTMLDHFTVSAKEIAFIKESGIGKLLHGAAPGAGAVAVHYSNPCLHASTVNPEGTSWEFSHQDFAAVISECSLPYEFLSPPEIEKGGVPGRFKTVILPCSQALSSAECAALRAFVERGGLLIADVLPGEMDEHCRFRDRSPLADVFGEKLVPRRVGSGFTVLTGDFFHGAEGRVGEGFAGGMAAGLLRYLALTGFKPSVTVKDECGSHKRADIWVKDSLTCVCMMGPAEPTGAAAAKAGAEGGTRDVAAGGSGLRTVEFDREVTLYDLAAGGTALGRGRRFDVELAPTVGRVLVASERPLVAPRLERSAAAVARGEALEVGISEVNGCALVTVSASDGRTVFTDRVTGPRAVFVPAWNEPAGRYVMRVRSAVGGFESEVKFDVR